MDIINPYSYRPNFKKDLKINETNPKNPIRYYNQEEEFTSFVNTLSSLIKEFYITVLNIIKNLKNNSFELNKYILTSKCLINEMNSKTNIEERIKQFNKAIEGISLRYKFINNNLSSFEMNLTKLYNKSNLLFKKIKDNKKIKFNGILEINSINTNSSNNNQIILEQNNINQYNNKINCLKLSLDTNKLNSFSHTNKSNSNNSNSRRIWYTKRDNNENTINVSQKYIKHKNFDLLLGETDFLEKRINKDKLFLKDKSNRLRRRNYSQNNIITDIPKMPISNIDKIKNIFENTPEKKRISISTQKITPLCTNFNNYNYYYPYRSKCPSSGNITARKNEDCFNDYNINNYINKKKLQMNYDSSSSENYRINYTNNNSILKLIENIIEYFYLLSQYQNIIISTNRNNKDNNNIFVKLQNALITLNKSIFINNNIFVNKNFIKQKLLSLIKQNENINQRLKLLISRINYKNINYNNDIINNNYNETNKNNYKKIIEKLKNDNKTLTIMNQKNINNNKILIQKLNNIKEKNINRKLNKNNSDIQNKNNKINNLLHENKEYLFQIKNLKNDNEELLKLLKNKNNSKELLTSNSNSNSDINQFSNILDSYSDRDNNFLIIQKNNDIKNLKSIIEEIKLENNKLKDIDREQNNKIKQLNEIISSLKNKSNTNLILIKEKSSIIEELNIKIKDFENDINISKNKYNKDINIIKEQIEKNNEIKEKKIKELNQIIENKNTDINNINKDKLKIENELINIKKEIINKNEEIQNLNNKCQELNNKIDIQKKEINNEKVKTRNNNNIIEKDKEIKNLKKKIIELQKENNSINEEKNNCLKIIEQKGQEANQLDSIINVLKEKIKEFEKNKNNKNNEDDKIDIHDIENNIINYKKADEENENENKNNSNENNQYSIEMEDNNNENQSKRLSTPSFKSPEIEEDYMIKNKSDNIIELQKLNELLLKKITEYESILKVSQNNDEEEDNIINNESEIDNNINNDNTEIKYFQDKYIYYFKLSKEYQKKYEIYELSNENFKNDLHKAKSEIKELTKKLKENNINLDNNNNNYVTSLSSLILNNQYSPNEYIILCDKTYHNFKWFLMKKKNNEENEEEILDTYDNLIWVPKIDIVDFNNFNKYINEEEQNNNEILNLVKKLEEKENIISKLTYKLEKLEKDFEMVNSFNSFEQSMKNKNKVNNIFKNSINDDDIINDNGYILSIRKEASKNQKNIKPGDEPSIPMEKFNALLEKLNHSEENFAKLQKENIELRKIQKLYLNQNNNNQINIIQNDNNSQEIENGVINSNRKNENKINNINSNQSDEEDYYKNKYNELEMKIKILKDQIKNILMKLTIPKKYKEEIKQSLKLFDFSEEETLIIIGDKKK